MNRTLVGIIALLLGFSIFVLGWSAPAAFCYDDICEPNRIGQVQFIVGVAVGLAFAILGTRTLWRSLSPSG